MQKLTFVKPENYSEYYRVWETTMPKLKEKDYVIVSNHSIGGDAPKDFVKIYKYGNSKYKNRNKWAAYIAKIGHKWYPNESITEYLLNQLGFKLGLVMAESRLVWIHDHIRFLSKYFLNRDEELVHGADIFADYLSDKSFVEEVEAKQEARLFFTFQFVEKAVLYRFPNHAQLLMIEFVKMLFFDAIVGNNDRHFYNWAVILNVTNHNRVKFSPIYDTARGLFWNESESKIQDIFDDRQRQEAYLEKYIRKSMPKIGWEDCSGLNHIELIEKIVKNRQEFHFIFAEMLNPELEKNVLVFIETEFQKWMSKERIFLIKTCLQLRFQQLRQITHIT